MTATTATPATTATTPTTPLLEPAEIDRLVADASASLTAYPRSANLFASFRFAGAGLAYLFRTQRNARIHLAAAVAFTGLGVWLGLGTSQLAILWVTMTVVLMAEAFNTAVEAVVDLITDRYHPLARIAKDTAAGGVLLSALGAVAVGVALFLPPLASRAGF